MSKKTIISLTVIILTVISVMAAIIVLNSRNNPSDSEKKTQRHKVLSEPQVSHDTEENAQVKSLKELFGIASQEQFVSCLGSSVQTYPAEICGIVSAADLDVDWDGTEELVVLRVEQTNANQEARILAEVYQMVDGHHDLCAYETICDVSYCAGTVIYLFYSQGVGQYCIMVDSAFSGAYSGVNSRSADVYAIGEDSITRHSGWSSVPSMGIEDAFEEDFQALNVPYAKHFTTYDNRTKAVYFQPMCEVVHEIFGDSGSYETRNHRLKITDEVLMVDIPQEGGADSLWTKIPDTFIFTSGVGGWMTEIIIADDGTFTGEFHDSNMGITGEGYPYGTVNISLFHGAFSEPERISDTVYGLRLDSLSVENTPGEAYIEDGVRYVYADPYGFDDAEEFLLYLPGTSIEDMDEGFLYWAHLDTEVIQKMPAGWYGLYNIGGQQGFIGASDGNFWSNEYTYKCGPYKSTLRPSANSRSGLLFLSKDGTATISLSFVWTDEHQTHFSAVDHNGSGEYEIAILLNEDYSTAAVAVVSKEGADLSRWGGTEDGSLAAVYTKE